MTIVAPIMMITSPAAASAVRPGRIAQKSGEDQAERAEHLGDADESQEPARQRHRPCHLVERQDQFCATGQQKEGCEQP
jgi:hypothetical protein